MSDVKVYQIPSENMASVRAKIAKLAKKAARLNVQPVALEVVSTESSEQADGSIATLYNVTVSGPAPKLAGWMLVGVINITDEGTIVRTVPNVTTEGELAQYRDTKEHWCDHCRTRRYRLDTFIVRSDSGEYKQVGRTCLADFLGHVSPEAIVAGAEMLMSADDICEEGEYFGGGIRERERVSLSALLTQVAAEVRAHGWVSRSAYRNDPNGSRASVDVALDSMEDNAKCAASTILKNTISGPCHRCKKTHVVPTDADAKLADDAIEWVRNLPYSKTEKSDYLYNLTVACKGDMTETRQAGLAGSAISAYMREQAYVAERKAQGKNTEPMGKKGDKLTAVLTVLDVKPITSDYGSTMLHKFADAQGRRASWFASNEELTIGHTYRIAFKVKGYNDSYGETSIFYCKVLEEMDEETAEHLALTRSA